jgi:uncharacterized protein (DUF1810 family)
MIHNCRQGQLQTEKSLLPIPQTPPDLTRFITAQDPVYNDVLTELKSGQKQTHWMWFIFPQIDGLGHSSIAKRYAIKNADEAREYLRHPVLGKRLIECTETVKAIQNRSASQIFGYPDDLKFRSSMTLFASVSGEESIFHDLISKYYEGQADDRTIEILKAQAQSMNAGSEDSV